jgi:hypothetical protein
MSLPKNAAMEEKFQDLAVFESDDQIIIALDFGTTVSQR